MPIELPDLDDIDYDTLVASAIAALPGYGSDWTDYNPSDPGITMLEMLAWLTEMLVYRTDRIQPSSHLAFLELLTGDGAAIHGVGGPDTIGSGMGARFEDAPEETTRDVLLALRRPYRAVTVSDYEQLALTVFSDRHQPIQRLACLPGVDATDTGSGRPADLAGAISLVVMPSVCDADAPWARPSQDLLDSLVAFFGDRRLVTTQVRAAGPRYVPLRVRGRLYIDGDARPRQVLGQARHALYEYLHPSQGGSECRGWPFGRTVRATDLVARLSAVAGVSFADAVGVRTRGSRAAGEVTLEADQLPRLVLEEINLSAMVLKGGFGQSGTDWVEWDPGAGEA